MAFPRNRLRTPLAAGGALALVVLAAPLVGAAAPLAYFSVGPNVYRAVLDGAAPAELVTGTTGSLAIRGIALDPARGRFFTTRALNAAIETAPLTPGGSLSAVGIGSPGLANPGGITIDPGAARIYWGTEGGGTNGNLLSASVTGADMTTFATPGTGDKRVLGLAVDPSTRLLWWAQYTPGDAINWMRTDGSATGQLDTTGATVNAPRAIAISHRSGRVYWASFLNIGSALLTGGGGADIPSSMGPTGLAVDDAGGHLYWMEAAGPSLVVTIKRAGLDGQAPESVTPPNMPNGTINALALLRAPVQATAPAVTGTAVVGATLTCSAASWAADSPEAFAFRAPATSSVQWTRDGLAIAGAADDSHRVTDAGRYACRTIGTNAAGSTVATSDEITVPAVPAVITPATPAARGTGTAVGRLVVRWTLRGRAVTTTFRAPSGANRFTFSATRRGSRAAPARGRCRLSGTSRARSVRCAISLGRGSWTATVLALRGTTPLSRTSRAIRVRTGR